MRFRTIGTRRADQGVRLRPLVWALVMVSGFIFFCYNDYRTHMGDKGTGVMKPRIHGVVDLFGARKHSYEVLRLESSPARPSSTTALLRCSQSGCARGTLFRHIRSTVTSSAGFYMDTETFPLQQQEVELSALKAGEAVSCELPFKEQSAHRVEFDVLRPTGFSAFTRVWTP